MLGDVGGNAFPTFVFLDAEGEVLGKHNGGRSAAAFHSTRQAVVDMLAAKKKVDAGDESAQAALLIAEIKLGKVDLDGAKKGYEELDEVTDAEEAAILDLINGLEFGDMMAKLRRRQLKPEEFHASVLEMLENGRAPTGEEGSRDFWYYGVMPAALQKEDADLAKRALKTLEEHPFFQGDNARYLTRYREAVEALGK